MDKKLVVVVKGLVLYESKVLLMKRSLSSKVGGGEWELVGGKLQVGEDLEETLIREIEEEAGIGVIPQKILYASTINDDPRRQLVFLTYLCKAETNLVTLSEEHTDFYWANRTELKEMLRPNVYREFEKYHLFEMEELQ